MRRNRVDVADAGEVVRDRSRDSVAQCCVHGRVASLLPTLAGVSLDEGSGDAHAARMARASAAERSCADVSPGEARFLIALLDLSNESETCPSQAAIARHLRVAAPTALEMMRRLRTVGLVDASELRLTPTGLSVAVVLRSRRRAALSLLTRVLGMDEAQAELEAVWLASSASPPLGRSLVSWRARSPEDAGPSTS
jgi:Mn-dependent DtxR family transcriptional regulator